MRLKYRDKLEVLTTFKRMPNLALPVSLKDLTIEEQHRRK